MRFGRQNQLWFALIAMKQVKLAITIDRLRIDLVASIIVTRSKINKYDFDKKNDDVDCC